MPASKFNPKTNETKYSPLLNNFGSGKNKTGDKWKDGDHTEEMATEADREKLQDSNDTEDLFREEKDEPPPAEKLSPLRRLALLASLLFCVFVIFAFAFLLPCHGVKCKANCKHGNTNNSLPFLSEWVNSINISGIKPAFIKVVGFNHEPLKDIMLGYSAEQFCHGVCSGGLAAYSGVDGKRLWNLPTNGSVTSMVCRQTRNKDSQPLCIVSGMKSHLYRVGIDVGNLEWIGVLSGKIKDFDIVRGLQGDSAGDVVALQSLTSGKHRRDLSDQGRERLVLVSGLSGLVIGSAIPLPQNQISSSVLVTTHGLADKTEFVLFESHSANHPTNTLWAISARDLYKKTQNRWNSSSAIKWGTHSPDSATGFIQVVPDSVIPLTPVLQDLNLDGIRDIVICKRNANSKSIQVTALDGVNLQVLWKSSLPDSTIDKPLVPSFFDSDEIPDIAVQMNYGNLSSSVFVLSGANGTIVWTLSSSQVLRVASTGVPPFVSSSGGYLLWLPKSDLKILQESTLNTANSSVSKMKNRQRRETSELRGSHALQDFEIKLLNNIKQKSDEGRYSQDVVDDISQAVKDAKLEYVAALEDALIGEEFKKDTKRLESKFDDAEQVEEQVSRGIKDLSNELGELPGFSDGRRKRVVLQKEQQSLGAHEQIRQSRGGSAGRLRDSLAAQRSHKSDVHEVSSGNLHKPHDSSKHAPHDTVPQSSHDKPAKSPPAILHQDLKESSPRVESKSGATRDPLKSRDIIPQDSLEKSTQSPPISQPVSSLNHSLSDDGCVEMESDASEVLVAIFVHKPKGAPVELVKVVEQPPLYLGVEEYQSMFGSSPSRSAKCVKFVARIFQRPVLDDLGDRKLKLVYVVSYLEELPPSAHAQTRKRIVLLKVVRV